MEMTMEMVEWRNEYNRALEAGKTRELAAWSAMSKIRPPAEPEIYWSMTPERISTVYYYICEGRKLRGYPKDIRFALDHRNSFLKAHNVETFIKINKIDMEVAEEHRVHISREDTLKMARGI